MSRLQYKMEQTLTTPQKANGFLNVFLSVASKIYGAGLWVASRLRKPEKKLACKVVSIGNIAVGGTGKTPMTLYVTEMLKKAGYKAVILSRGYKGSAGKKGAIVSDGKEVFLTATQAGDEPYMLARALPDTPVIVSHDRYRGGQMAMAAFRPDIIVLDDGFQHRALYRDVDIVLLEATDPFGNGALLPKGKLREPVCALQRADIIVYTRAKEFSARKKIGFSTPAFACKQAPSLMTVNAHGAKTDPPAPISLDQLKGKRCMAFSGIAHNDQFVETVRENGGHIVGTSFYPDHHRYTKSELDDIVRQAHENNADTLIATQKDFARLDYINPFKMPLWVVGISVGFGPDEDGFKELLFQKLDSKKFKK